MEAIFEQLRKDRMNTVQKLVMWTIKARIGGVANDPKSNLQMFNKVADPNNVTLSEFSSVVDRISQGNNTSTDAVRDKLVASGKDLSAPTPASVADQGLGFRNKRPF